MERTKPPGHAENAARQGSQIEKESSVIDILLAFAPSLAIGGVMLAAQRNYEYHAVRQKTRARELLRAHSRGFAEGVASCNRYMIDQQRRYTAREYLDAIAYGEYDV